MAGLLDRQGVVGLLGPTTLDPFADTDGLRDRRDMIAPPHPAEMSHPAEMPQYQIVEDANGVRHLVPLDPPPPVRLTGLGTLPMIDAEAPRVAGLPMLGDSDAPNAMRARPLHVAQDDSTAKPGVSPEENPREAGIAMLKAAIARGEKPDANAAYRSVAWRTAEKMPPASSADLAASGATLGFGDELMAGAMAPLDAVARGETLEEAYSHNLAAERERLARYRERNSVKGFLSEMVGSAAVPFGTLRTVSTLPQKVTQGAIAGGTYGAISGASNAEGDLVSRAEGARNIGLLSMMAGGTMPTVAAGLRAVTKPVTDLLKGAVSPERRAVDVLRRDLARDKVRPGDAIVQLEDAAAAGKPMTIGDLGGSNITELGRAVAAGRGVGSEAIHAITEARKLDAPGRIVDDLRAATATPEAFYATLEGIIAKRREIAAPLREAAFAKPMPDTPGVRSILSTPAGQSAVENAQRMSANKGIELKADVRGMDMIIESLDDMIAAARRNGQNNEAGILSDMNKRLVREVGRSVPEYRAARDIWSSEFNLEQAIARGHAFLKPSARPEVAVAEIKAMSPAEREVVRMGMAREIQAMFEDGNATLSKINQLLNSPRLKPVVGAMFETPEAYTQFRNALLKEQMMLRRGQEVTGGSPTADKPEDAGLAGAALKVARGNVLDGAVSAAKNVERRMARGVNEKTDDKLGEMLATTDLARQKEILAGIEAMLPPGWFERLSTLAAGRAVPIGTHQ